MNRHLRYAGGSLPVGPARSDRLEAQVAPQENQPSSMLERPAQTPLVWRDDWCMGIPALDSDHRRLVTLVNALLSSRPRFEQYLGGTGDDREPDTAEREPFARFEALLDHLRDHFEREEALMLSIDYDDFQSHKCEHSLQIAELTELRRQVSRERGGTFSQESLQWVKRWCFDHFIAEDRRLGQAYADAMRP